MSPDSGIIVTSEFVFFKVGCFTWSWQDPQLAKTKLETDINISKDKNNFLLFKVLIIKLL